jgi:hypothetical protein
MEAGMFVYHCPYPQIFLSDLDTDLRIRGSVNLNQVSGRLRVQIRSSPDLDPTRTFLWTVIKNVVKQVEHHSIVTFCQKIL